MTDHERYCSPDLFGVWRRKIAVKRVIDGDTVVADIYQGWNDVKHDQRIRLADIDAPETSGDQKLRGVDSRNALEDLISDYCFEASGIFKIMIFDSMKRNDGTLVDSFGRMLGTIYGCDLDRKLININQKMIDDGFAKRLE